ncbi:hypothetical protein FACS1894217_04640 [Clostridia bacterium]|nr:hypothetical protein FACS1894217_04640 [Clostridia bacterium]
MRELTLGSLFDGIGGFPLAAKKCGIRTVWASEIEPNCIDITRRHFSDMRHLGDISNLHGGQLPPVDIISFGSPCQDLSVAGRRQGLDGERSGLFKTAVRLIYEMREATHGQYPTIAIWENVPGAFSSNSGDDFRTVLEELAKTDIPKPNSGRWAESGMVRVLQGVGNPLSVAWRTLDCQHWGIPQRRKRIYLVASFGNVPADEIQFIPESVLQYATKSKTQEARKIPAFGSGIGEPSGNICDFGRTADRIYINPDKSRTITATNGGQGSATGLYLLPICDGAIHGDANGTGIGNDGDPAPTLTGRDRHGIAIIEARPIDLRNALKNTEAAESCGAGIGESGESEYTLTAEMPHGVAICYAPSGFGDFSESADVTGTLRASAGPHGASSANLLLDGRVIAIDRAAYNQGINAKFNIGIDEDGTAYTLTAKGPGAVCAGKPIGVVRKLTPTECERLQGFPDDWTKTGASRRKISDSARYKALGNSLATVCAERVFRGIQYAVNRYIPPFLEKSEVSDVYLEYAL